MNSFNFQIVQVADLAAIVTPFPDHICYFTEDTENYYIWENNALKEIFVDTSSLTWNNITNKPTTISGFGITDAVKANNGTVNYVSKFTPDGTTIGNSQIQDNGSTVGIGVTPSNTSKLNIISSNDYTLNARNTAANNPVGVYGSANGGGTAVGIQGYAEPGATTSVGVVGQGTSQVGKTAIGGRFIASGGSSNYAIQLKDSTNNVVGRYLRNMTTEGEANWANINITEVTNGLSSTLLGAPNGIATLDNNSKLVISQMPISVMDYKGTYDIITNIPTLVDGTGNQGDVYVCTTAGTRTFGPGNTITVGVGDWLIYNGTKWEKTLGNNVGSGTVNSVGLSLGTTGTDVNVSNSPITTSGNINLNIPTASASARGLLSAANWTAFNNKVDASINTLGFVARFVGTNLIGNGSIQDTGANVGIGTAPATSSVLSVNGLNGSTYAIYATTTTSGNGRTALRGDAFGDGVGTNTGVSGYCENAQGPCIGVNGLALGKGTSNFPIIGGFFKASNSLNNSKNYSVQLQDGSETVQGGKFLKDKGDGKANWANITTADVSGAVGAAGGTNNYVAKFTPNGTTIGNSQIQDNGTTLSIGTSLDADYKIKISGNTLYGLYFSNDYTGSNPSTAILANCTGISTSQSNTGITGSSANNPTKNIGVYGQAVSNGSITNIGIMAKAQGGTNNYSAQLQDGTQAQNKFLKSVLSDGSANWAYLPDSAQIMCSDMTTSISASITLAKSFWIAPCDGLLVESFSNLYTAQAGGIAFTVTIKQNGTLISTMTFTNGASSSNTVTLNSATFTKGTLFEIFVTQVGDGTAKGLLTTINYLRS